MCPGPILQLKKNYAELKEGEALVIKATDQAFGKDVASWCKMTGAQLTSLENRNGIVAATIQKQRLSVLPPRASLPITRPSLSSVTTSTRH